VPLQVVVVDGGSFDGCGEMLQAEFPDVDFVQATSNVGFGASNNLGLPVVTGEALLLLNPDTELGFGAVQGLLHELTTRPDAGIVAPQLLNADGTRQLTVHALPRPVFQALDCTLLRRVFSPLGLWAPPADFAPRATVAVGAVAGACMLTWTRTFRDVGGFSGDYFMYAEDMDLCLKLRRKGLKTYFAPEPRVLHHSGASSSNQGTSFSAVMMREALHTYFLVNHGRGSAMVYRATTAAWAVPRWSVSWAHALVSPHSRLAERRANNARWGAILSWSLGGQRWSRGYRGNSAAPRLTRQSADVSSI